MKELIGEFGGAIIRLILVTISLTIFYNILLVVSNLFWGDVIMRTILDEFGLTVVEALGGLVVLYFIFFVFGQFDSIMNNDIAWDNHMFSWIKTLVDTLIGV